MATVSKPERPLTPRELLFVREYAVDLNGKEAAIRAGYAPANAKVAASRLLKRPAVKAAVDAELAKKATRVDIRADDVLRELATIALSDVGAILDFSGADPKLRPASEIPEAARRCIQSVKVQRYTEGRGDDAREVEVTEFRLWPKVAALQEIARLLGMAKPQKVEHSGPDGGAIPVEVKHTDAEIASQLAKYAAEFERAAGRMAAEQDESESPGGDAAPDGLPQPVPPADREPGGEAPPKPQAG